MKSQVAFPARSLFSSLFLILLPILSLTADQSVPFDPAVSTGQASAISARAQSAIISDRPRLECRIDQISPRDRKLHVNCKVSDLSSGSAAMRFADSFAGVNRLSDRLFALKVKDQSGGALPLEIKGDGFYLFNNADLGPSITIDYEVHLERPLDPSQSALTSSLGPDSGFLLLGDLIPGLCHGTVGDCEVNPLKLRIDAPSGWQIAANEESGEKSGDGAGDGLIEIANPQQAVFFLGRLRQRVVTVRTMQIRMVIAGVWNFSDEDVFKLTQSIAGEQAAVVDGAESGGFLVTLAPYPLPLTGLRSSAVTIGRTVVLLLNPNDSATQTFAHLRRHLAHEMFHFYLPNLFRVRENFDWFWEGCSRYFALLTLARLRLIGLDEYLDAVGGEYEAYASNPIRTQISLIKASTEKFANLASYDLVYRKGTLVAALYDLELRRQSKGKSSLIDAVRGLYQKYARRNLEIGNREVLDELGRWGDFARLIRDDIEGTREIDLAERVKPYGLVVESGRSTAGRIRIRKAPGLSGKQRELLDQLVGE